MTRVLVCGGRDYADWATVERILDRVHIERHITCIIEGGASGADKLGAHWADIADIPEHVMMTADWKAHGRAAGPMRNQRMLDEGVPDLVVAFAGGRGTASMIRLARQAGVEVMEVPDAA